MRNILLVSVMVVVLASSCFASGFSAGLEYNLGGDISGTAKLPSGNETVSFRDLGGIGLTGSYFQMYNENIELGGGLTYYLPRTVQTYRVNSDVYDLQGDGAYNEIPIFFRARYFFNPQSTDLVYYAGGDLRYSLISLSGKGFEDVSGLSDITAKSGIGYGIFGGVTFSKMYEIEAGYIIQNASFDWKTGGNTETQNVSESMFYLKGSLILDAFMK